jgi:hypothetical protein
MALVGKRDLGRELALVIGGAGRGRHECNGEREQDACRTVHSVLHPLK